VDTHICVTCGTGYPPSDAPPDRCPICEDDRQYINPSGQTWTTLTELRAGHTNRVEEVEPGLVGVQTDPRFAIGQRALLVQGPEGNVLWDCISLIDDDTVKALGALGGVDAIAISHPHFYSSMVAWSRAFGDAPIYLHESNREWVMCPDERIVYWPGETTVLGQGVTLIRCGGHFPGSTALHWADGAEGRGALLTGDTIYVVSDARYVTFMYSYPNMIPLSAESVRRITAAVEPYAFDRLYAAWPERVVMRDAKAAVRRSAERYIAAIGG
jgi:glyoxylase-like metal-dependent hydrolase (beta-lactamase superfamily II)